MSNIHLYCHEKPFTNDAQMQCGYTCNKFDVEKYETIVFSNVTCPGCMASERYKMLKELDAECRLIEENKEEKIEI